MTTRSDRRRTGGGTGVELVKLFSRRRTWVAILLLNLLPTIVAVLLAWTGIAPRPGAGPAFLSAVVANGSLFGIAALAIVLPLFLPIAVAVVAGESVAGEAQSGTLRYHRNIERSGEEIAPVAPVAAGVPSGGGGIGAVPLAGVIANPGHWQIGSGEGGEADALGRKGQVTPR